MKIILALILIFLFSRFLSYIRSAKEKKRLLEEQLRMDEEMILAAQSMYDAAEKCRKGQM